MGIARNEVAFGLENTGVPASGDPARARCGARPTSASRTSVGRRTATALRRRAAARLSGVGARRSSRGCSCSTSRRRSSTRAARDEFLARGRGARLRRRAVRAPDRPGARAGRPGRLRGGGARAARRSGDRGARLARGNRPRYAASADRADEAARRARPGRRHLAGRRARRRLVRVRRRSGARGRLARGPCGRDRRARGPNGSGKTTLAKIAAGLLEPARGHGRTERAGQRISPRIPAAISSRSASLDEVALGVHGDSRRARAALEDVRPRVGGATAIRATSRAVSASDWGSRRPPSASRTCSFSTSRRAGSIPTARPRSARGCWRARPPGAAIWSRRTTGRSRRTGGCTLGEAGRVPR